MIIKHFETLPSTNLYLKENYHIYDNMTIVTCDHQTSGRGRLGRTWYDGDDLLFSILIKNNLNKATDFSLLIAATVLKIIKLYVNNVTIKWPNDIMVKDKKIAGILLESVSNSELECVIIGVGINCNTDLFPDDLRIKATSLRNEMHKYINKDNLLNEIANMFQSDYDKYLIKKSDYLDIIKNNFYLKDKEVIFIKEGKELKGKALSINDDGDLTVLIDEKIINVHSGEVTLHNIYCK